MAGSEAQRGADKAFEGKHDTQAESKSEEGANYTPNEAAESVGESIADQGNEFAFRGREPGRGDDEERSAGRKSARSTGRLSSGVAPSDPIDPESPNIPAP